MSLVNFMCLQLNDKPLSILRLSSDFQIRSDTSLCLTKTMPEIEAKCKEMNDIFTHIDHLEVRNKFIIDGLINKKL